MFFWKYQEKPAELRNTRTYPTHSRTLWMQHINAKATIAANSFITTMWRLTRARQTIITIWYQFCATSHFISNRQVVTDFVNRKSLVHFDGFWIWSKWRLAEVIRCYHYWMFHWENIQNWFSVLCPFSTGIQTCWSVSPF